MFPYRIPESEIKYEYAKYAARYHDVGGYASAMLPPDADWRYYTLNLGSDSGYRYEEVPRPMYNSLGASGSGGDGGSEPPLPPLQASMQWPAQKPQDDPRPDELGGVMQYLDPEHGAVLPLMKKK